MQTDTVAWNAGKSLIDRRDMPLELLQERPLIEMRKVAGALHRQVGCIDLQHMPASWIARYSLASAFDNAVR